MTTTPFPWPDGAEPTPEQLAGWLRACTHADRVEFATSALQAMRDQSAALRRPDAPGTARDRLLQAIRDVDAEVLGERSPDQVLTSYVVVYVHRKIGESPDDDSDALARLTMPGQPLWQTLGLLNAGAAWVSSMYGDSDG